MSLRRMRWLLILMLLVASARAGAPDKIPDDFPRFIVPGHQKEMDLLRELFWLHYRSNGPQATLWDEWIPMATLWPAGFFPAHSTPTDTVRGLSEGHWQVQAEQDAQGVHVSRVTSVR